MSIQRETGKKSSGEPVKRLMWPFAIWLAGFYSFWMFLVASRDLWSAVAGNWEISLAMMFGSFIAGSTPMGGGTIGFPILVLLLDELPSLGRDFSFCIQSIGMTSASIWILCRRIPVDWGVLRPALFGVLLGTPVGLIWFAPLVPAVVIKTVFAMFWGIFGLTALLRYRDFSGSRTATRLSGSADSVCGFVCGLLGSVTVASITGVGTDMLIFMMMVLLKRSDLRVAIPTSVILMAATSLVGVASQVVLGQLDAAVFPFWLAASPIVIVGAPIGAVVVNRVGRTRMLMLVAVLCFLQLVWTLVREAKFLSSGDWAITAIAAVLLLGLFLVLDWLGRKLAREPELTPDN